MLSHSYFSHTHMSLAEVNRHGNKFVLNLSILSMRELFVFPE